MIHSIVRAISLGATVVSALFVAQSASAATVFTFTNKGTTSMVGVGSYTFASDDGSLSVKATAWHANDSNTSAITTDSISRAQLGFWSNAGLGVIYGTDNAFDGSHQIDNKGLGAGADFVMLQFNKDVTIDSLARNVYGISGIGCCDSDAAFWADTSNIFGAPSLLANINLSSASFNESIFTALPGTGSSGTTKLGTTSSASVWLVSAALNQRNDGFKIAGLSVTPTGAVPEPATWAMMILGMGAVGFAMRRRSAVKTTVSYA
ncbi:PEPxxWA-CTERM sorting domain-containing protein [Sphingomonas endolithica]|uniref:PEPxxWA-CTERM sorting domain-containing protein n=1 Tax=Sphingomonas endolithica TaxID=2972485 RepID=UPI0021AE9549|nr:PEPxxWA-CTERM sorting domain-containing protein [Sphingomonas sp. ZFBP2030]